MIEPSVSTAAGSVAKENLSRVVRQVAEVGRVSEFVGI
jgi:hypothetical protein